MWALRRRTAPSCAGAGGGEPTAEVHALADLQAGSVEGGAGVVAQARPGAVEAAADVGTAQADRANVARAGSGEPAAQEYGLVDLQGVAAQGGARLVAQARPIAFEAAADVGAGQADSALAAGAGGGEPAEQQHALADLKAVSQKCRAGVVAQRRPHAGELATDAGADQANRTGITGARGSELVTQEHAQADLQAIGDQGRARLVAQGRPGAVEVDADVGTRQADRTVLARRQWR